MAYRVDELFRQHRNILDVVNQIEHILDTPSQPDIPELFRLRHKLARLCKDHLISEQQKIFEPLRKIGGETQIPDFESFPRAIREIWLDFSTHTARWDTKAVIADWENYVRSARIMILAIRAMGQREEVCLYAPAIVILMRLARETLPDARPMG